ncbi:MAG: hypothetical protein E6I94_03590 [Chloroflexi bacterium]|nr:MAG: hypothetical protein E6I94_03590 [Chloroflexota bacterium]
MVLRGAPGPAHEWRLTRLEGTLVDVKRTGDRWRAEVEVGSQRVVVAGTPGAGIPPTALVEGRRIVVIGIVRRPYPTATDRRFSVNPRGPADLRLGGPATAPNGSNTSPAAAGASGQGQASASDGTAAVDVDLGELGGHVGETVRVGGLIESIDERGFVLDDGTGQGRIALLGEARSYLPLLAQGDPLNAIGVVAVVAGTAEVRVTDPAGIVRVEALDTSQLDPSTGPRTGPTGEDSSPADSGTHLTTAGGLPGIGDAETAGFGTLLAISLLSAAITVLRRRRMRRALAMRITARLATIGGSVGPREGPRGAS